MKKDCHSYISLRRTGVQSLFRPFNLEPKLFLFNLISLIIMKTNELLYMTQLLQVLAEYSSRPEHEAIKGV